MTPQRVAFGRSADVYRGRWENASSLHEVAIKSLQIPRDAQPKLIKRLWRELRLWRSLDHDNVLPFFGIVSGFGDIPALVSPWCRNQDLCSYIAPRVEPYGYHPLRLSLVEQVVRGVEYLHNHDPPIIHCDLKGVNILVSDDGRPLLADFGSAFMDMKNNSTTLSTNGTLRWMSPELVLGEPSSAQSDMWAVACVVVELYSGGMPPYVEFKNDMRVIQEICRGTLPERPYACPYELWVLLRQCWLHEPALRPSATGFLAGVQAVRNRLQW